MAGDEALRCVAKIFSQVPDPRKRRGVRHPFGAILSLVFLGLVVRITEMAALVRWAKDHWSELKDALGFTRDKPPCDTTISRALAGLTVETFQQAFREVVQRLLALEQEPLVAAVDGKACRQGKDEDGSPVMILHVFVQKLKLTIQQWQLKGSKTNEATALREHVCELSRDYPLVMLLTGDAIFAQRPLLEVLQKEGLDYLFQVKGNQPELLEALKVCFADAESRPPDAKRTGKKGARGRHIGCG